MSRTSDRVGQTMPVRMSLLESDLDQNTKEHAEIAKEMERLLDQLSKILLALLGALAGLATACFLLVVNIMVTR